MKIIPRNLLFFLIGCALIGFLALPPVVAVGAQVLATITATQTFIPPSPTATGFVKSCPIGTPAGWGTYTPSPLWGLECGACASIQGTGTPTQTVTPWIGTGTPPVGCTPFPSGTGTPSAGCSMTVTPVPTIQPSAVPTASPNWTWDIPAGASFNRAVSNGGLTLHVWGSGSFGNIVEIRLYLHSIKYTTVALPSEIVPIYFSIAMLPSRGWWSFTNFQGTRYYPSGGIISGFQNISLSRQLPSEFQTWAADGGTYSSFDAWWNIGSPVQIEGTSTPTVAPSPTATPYFDGGYCSTIAPPLSDFGFDLFVPSGVANCSLGWEAFTAGTIEVPAVKICFQPSEFGVIKLFGSDYEIGIIALAAAAAFIWRFMRTV